MALPRHITAQAAIVGTLREASEALTRPQLKDAFEIHTGTPISETALGKALHALLDEKTIVTTVQKCGCGYRHDVFGIIIAEEPIVVPIGPPRDDGYGERPVDDAEPGEAEQVVLDLGDERIEGSGSAAFAEWRADVGRLLAQWGEVTDLGRGGKNISEASRAAIRERAGVLGDHWPSFRLDRGDGVPLYVVPVTASPKNMRVGREWRIGMAAFKLHRAFAEWTNHGRLVYAFANGEGAFMEDLKAGTNYVVTDRGNNEHIAVARGKFRPLSDLLAEEPVAA